MRGQFKYRRASFLTFNFHLRLHSMAGGGLNGAHSGLGQPSQDDGMWNDI